MADDKRTKILEATLELVARQGFHGTPASQIAKQAGVGVGTIYRYFKDKDELIRELHLEASSQLRDHLHRDLPEFRDLKEKFFELFSRLLREFIRHPRTFRFLEQYHFSPYSSCLSEEDDLESDDIFIVLLRELREAGLIKNLPRRVLKPITFGPLVSLVKEYESRPFPVDETIIAITVQACWDAISTHNP